MVEARHIALDEIAGIRRQLAIQSGGLGWQIQRAIAHVGEQVALLLSRPQPAGFFPPQLHDLFAQGAEVLLGMGVTRPEAEAGVVIRLDVGHPLLRVGEGDVIVASGIRLAAVLLAAGQNEAAEQGKGKGRSHLSSFCCPCLLWFCCFLPAGEGI